MNADSEREDGEIVDDDVFEDVSDCSITSAFHSGKSFAYQDNISPVSLSSFSESDNVIPRHGRGKEYTSRRKRRPSYHTQRYNKRYRTYAISSDSTSDEEQLDRSVLKQLKEAVRINNNGSNNNNLQTRLKRMLNTESDKRLSSSDSDSSVDHNHFLNQDEDLELQKLRSDALSTKTAKEENEEIKEDPDKILSNADGILKITESNKLNDSIDDQELIELRLAALKSAIIKKHMNRKKKKEEEEQKDLIDNMPITVVTVDEMNKENAITNPEDLKNTDNVVDHKESIKKAVDEEINNIATEKSGMVNSENLNSTIEEDIDIMRAKLLASISKKITEINYSNVNAVAQSTPNPIAKITQNVTAANAQKISSTNATNTLSNIKTNNNVLKMPSVKPLVININGASESESESDLENESVNKSDINDTIAKKVTEFLKKTRAEVEANIQTENFKQTNSSIASETCDSILVEKSAMKLLPKSQQQEYRMLKQKLLNAKKKRGRKPSLRIQNGIAHTLATNQLKPIQNNNTTDLKTIQKPLMDLELIKNERKAPAQVGKRLQMKGKYKELGPLLQKVNQASAQKKKLEQQINHLLDELKQARKLFVDSQLNFSKLVKQLILKKEILDKRINKLKTTAFKRQLPSSTPLKEKPETKSVESSNIIQPELNSQKTEMLPQENVINKEIVEEIDNNGANTKMENFTEYISPLGSTTGNIITDPLGTFCPYEIFGVCKDSECTYKHYS